MLLVVSSEHGEIQHGEREMLYKVFDFADKEASDVMVPRPEVVALSVEMPPEEALRAVLDSPTPAIRCFASRSTTSSACCTCATSSPR